MHIFFATLCELTYDKQNYRRKTIACLTRETHTHAEWKYTNKRKRTHVQLGNQQTKTDCLWNCAVGCISIGAHTSHTHKIFFISFFFNFVVALYSSAHHGTEAYAREINRLERCIHSAGYDKNRPTNQSKNGWKPNTNRQDVRHRHRHRRRCRMWVRGCHKSNWKSFELTQKTYAFYIT